MWNKLSMSDRARYIRLAVANGITNIDDIKNIYNEYATGGALEDEENDNIPVVYDEQPLVYEEADNPEEQDIPLGNNRYQRPDGSTYTHYTNAIVTPDNEASKQEYYNYLRQKSLEKTNGRWGSGEFADALTGGIFNWSQPSQAIRGVYDFATGDPHAAEGLILGNTGVVSDNFMANHPIVGMGANLLTDIVTLNPKGAVQNILHTPQTIANATAKAANKVYTTPYKVLGNKSLRTHGKIFKNTKKELEKFDALKQDIQNNLIEQQTNLRNQYLADNPTHTIELNDQGSKKVKDIFFVNIDSSNKINSYRGIDFIDPITGNRVVENVPIQGTETIRFRNKPDYVTTTSKLYTVRPQSSSKVADAVADYSKAIKTKIGDLGIVGGSTEIYGKNYAVGAPNDLEIITTESRLPKLQNSLSGQNLAQHGEYGYRFDSPYAVKGEPVDVQVIKGDTSSSWGPLAEEYYSLLYPEEYKKIIQEATNKTFNLTPKQRSMGQQFPPEITGLKIEFPISADALYEEILKNPAIQEKKLLKDMFLSDKTKHVDRAYQMLTHPDAAVRNEAREAMRRAGKQYFKDFKLASEEYPNMKFDDVEANREFLKYLDLDESFATDPDIVRNIFDRWHNSQTLQSRNVYIGEHLKNIENLEQAMRTTTSLTGQYAGQGGNTVRYWGKGGIGGMLDADFNGILRNKLTYNPENFDTPLDLVNQVKRLSNNTSREYYALQKFDTSLREAILSGDEDAIKVAYEAQQKAVQKLDYPMYLGSEYGPPLNTGENAFYSGNTGTPELGMVYPIPFYGRSPGEIGGMGIPRNIASKTTSSPYYILPDNTGFAYDNVGNKFDLSPYQSTMEFLKKHNSAYEGSKTIRNQYLKANKKLSDLKDSKLNLAVNLGLGIGEVTPVLGLGYQEINKELERRKKLEEQMKKQKKEQQKKK